MSFSLSPALNESGSRAHSVDFNVITHGKLNIRMKRKLLPWMFL